MNQLVPTQPNTLQDFAPNQLALIRRTVAADLNEDEFDVFINIARTNGLNPFKKQIYAIVYNKNKPNTRKVTYITSIAGYRAVAARSGGYRPDEEAPRIIVDDAKVDPENNPLGIDHAEVTVNRFGADGQWYPITSRAYWDELAPLKENPDDFDYVETGGTWPDRKSVV